MKKTKTLTITILALFLLVGCKNDITTKNKDVTTKNRDMLTIYNDENISFGLDEKNKIKQWAFDNDGTFDYFMNDIENWGDNPQKSRKNCDINYVSDDMSNESVETIIAIIDTSFSIDKYSMRDSVWINLNENNISSSDVKKIVIDNVKISKELGVYVKSSGMLNEKAAVENCFEY